MDTRQSPVPAMTVRHENTLTKSDLYNKTFLGDANTLLLLQKTATHTHPPADSVDPVPATTMSSPPTHKQSEQDPNNESGTDEFQGYDIEENNHDPGVKI